MQESFERKNTVQIFHKDIVPKFLSTIPAFNEVELVDQQEDEGVYTTTFNGSYEFKGEQFQLLVVAEGPLQREENGDLADANEIRIIIGDPKASISLTIVLFEQHDVLSSRTSVYKDDENKLLPSQIGATLYKDLVFSFFQYYAEKEDREVLHTVRHGSVSNVKMERSKWTSIFEQMLVDNGYEHIVDEQDYDEKWQRLYKPSV